MSKLSDRPNNSLLIPIIIIISATSSLALMSLLLSFLIKNTLVLKDYVFGYTINANSEEVNDKVNELVSEKLPPWLPYTLSCEEIITTQLDKNNKEIKLKSAKCIAKSSKEILGEVICPTQLASFYRRAEDKLKECKGDIQYSEDKYQIKKY